LNPGLNHHQLSKQEEDIIFEKYNVFGKQWVLISSFLPCRSENTIKNCFYSTVRKQTRFFFQKFQEISKS